ncbi:MAG: energy transducer TonB [Acidobacteriota bacterium]|jgi:TonB family protein|nr:TonB C-terminal domain-containing protein [Bryobacteraceae bacterium CoA2 C42]MCA2964753.1 TonB C-terminal domain-containing protein [Acidobacteriaceae bacterium]
MAPSDPKPLQTELPTLYGVDSRLEPRPWPRILGASVGLHLLAAFLLRDVAIFEARSARPLPQTVARVVTPLYLPNLEPTQPEPNKAKVNRTFDENSLKPRPNIQIPQGQPSTNRPAARIPAPVTGRPEPVRLPEPPKIEAEQQSAKLVAPGALGLPAAPPPPERPKIQFESVGSMAASGASPGAGAVPLPPSRSISEVARETRRSSGGIMVGDGAGEGIGGVGTGINLPPSPGRTGSNLELLSDPMGVDFRPYLIRILAAVRRNWQAVIPESARMGQRGRVVVQFAVARNGSVPKLVIAGPSGAPPLDRAAVAGISASNPFPPLPAEFKGEQIRLQFTFTYNQQNSGIR